MAAADYYLCDVCSAKTFYDANLHYDKQENWERIKWFPVGAGDMAVLCRGCAQTHEVRIVPKEGAKK